MLRTMRKALSFVLVIAMLMSMACISNIGVSATANTYKLGDVNRDGAVNIRDATLIQYYAAYIEDLDADQLYLANVNGDDTVNVRDATYIQYYAAYMLDEYATNKDGKKIGDEVTIENGQLVNDTPTTITVYFTDALGWGNANIFYWDNGGDWPGNPMTVSEEDNGFGQKVYKAEIPSDAKGIVFNDGAATNAKQTVDITTDIADGAQWYTIDEKDGQGHYKVVLVGSEEGTTAAPEGTTAAPEGTTAAPEGTTAAPATTNTVKFTNNKGWSKVYLYAWADGAGDNAAWPGVELTEKATNGLGEEQYTATFDSKFTKIIFNNGSEQTVDIDYDNTVTGYYPTQKNGEGKWEVGSWKDEPSTSADTTAAPEGTTAAPEGTTAAPTGTNTVKFTNNKGWSKVYLYAWADGAGDNAAWPGVELTEKATNGLGEEQYTATFDSKFTKIIFNNGSEQTVDIDYDNTVTGYYPTQKNGEGKWEVGSWKDEPSTSADTTAAPEGTTAKPEEGTTAAPEGTTAAPAGTNTVKFTNNKGWSKVYLYAWADGAGDNAAWPGVELTEKATNGLGEEQYTATFDSKFTKIIFNNGSEQTVDIDYDNTVTGYYPTQKNGEGKWEVGSWKDEPSTSADTTAAPEGTTVAGDTYTFYYLPSAEQEAANSKYKLNYNETTGTTPEYWHLYDFVATNRQIGGVTVYGVQVPKTHNAVAELQYQVCNSADEWVSQNVFKQVNLSDYDNVIIKADGTKYTDTESTTAAPEGTTAKPEEGTTAAPAGTNTVKFTNNKGWSKVYLYAWADGAGDNAAWPGVELTEKATNGLGEEQYTATFDSKFTKIIFNNGSEQTVDIDYDNTVTGYYPTQKNGEGKWEVGSWKDEPSTSADTTAAPEGTTAKPEEGTTAAPEGTTAAPAGTNTVKFTNNKGWDKVYLYAWTDGAGDNAAWPGVELTEKATNGLGEEQYTATFDSKFTKIIFNNGSEQTVDIDYDNTVTGYYPTQKNGEGKWEVGSWKDEPSTSADTTAAPEGTTAKPEEGTTAAPEGTTAAPAGTNTVKFTNNKGWDKVYLYAWTDDAGASVQNAEWPGVELTDKSTNGLGEEQYTATIDSKYKKLIFSNGSSEQTVDITYDSTVTGYYPIQKNGEGKWEVGSWKDEPATSADTTAAPEGTTVAGDTYTFYYLPSAEQEAANSKYKLNYNETTGTTPEYWHLYDFVATNRQIGGVTVYGVQVPKTHNAVAELQYQVCNSADEWVSQNVFKQVNLSDYDNVIIKADGTKYTDTESTTAAPEGTTAKPEEGTTAAPAGTNTVKFTNNKGWDKVYLYAWTDGAGDNAAWPGVELTEKATNGLGEEQYTATFDAKYKNIIFNNGSEQTVDIAYDNTVTGYYPTQKNGEGKWEVGSWTDEPATSADTTAAPEGTTVAGDTYTFYYLPSAEQEAANSKYKLNYNETTGTTPEYWHLYDFVATNRQIGGVTVYGVQVPKTHNAVAELQYQVCNSADEWVSQNVFKQVNLSDYDNVIIKADGTKYTDTESTTAAPEGTTVAPTTAAPATTNTVKFTNNKGWNKVYLYAWTDGTGTNAEWPGVELTDKATNGLGEEQYTATFDAKYKNIIFNNGSEQTVDIAYDNTVTGYYPTQKNGEGKWEVGSWTDEPATSADTTAAPEGTTAKPEDTTAAPEGTTAKPEEGTTAAPATTNTVKFTNNKGWSKVYLYAWTDGTGTNAEWPGVELTDKATNGLGEEQYTATFDAKYKNIIFNNGSEQTVDIAYDSTVTGYYPTQKNGEGKWEVGSWKDEPATSADTTAAPEGTTAKPEEGTTAAPEGTTAKPEEGTTAAPATTNTVKFTNNKGWDKVYLYAWTDDAGASVQNAEWPGVELTEKATNGLGEEQFTATIDAKYKKVIFNNGGSEQTVDISIDDAVTGYYPTQKNGEGKWEVGSWKDEPSTSADTTAAPEGTTAKPEEGTTAAPEGTTAKPEEGTTAAPATTNTVKFTNNKGWDKVYLYAWTDDAGASVQNAEWPGVELTEKATNGLGEEQFTATIDAKYKKVIFNNGGSEQTVDISIDDAVTGYYPTQKNGEGKWEVGSWTDQPATSAEGTTAAPTTAAPTTAASGNSYTYYFVPNADHVTAGYTFKLNVNDRAGTTSEFWHQFTMTKTDDKVDGVAVYKAEFTVSFTEANEIQYQTWNGDTWVSEVVKNGSLASFNEKIVKADGTVSDYKVDDQQVDATDIIVTNPEPTTTAPADTTKTVILDLGGVSGMTGQWRVYTWNDDETVKRWSDIYNSRAQVEDNFLLAHVSDHTAELSWSDKVDAQTVDIKAANNTTYYILSEKDGNNKHLVSTTAPTTEAPTTEAPTVEPTTAAPTVAPTTAAPTTSETYTFKFTNNPKWSDVYVYAWKDGGSSNAAWPGVKLTDKTSNDYGEEQYTVTLDTTYTKMIFSNGNGTQTVDVTIDQSKAGYYTTGAYDNGKLVVGSW